MALLVMAVGWVALVKPIEEIKSSYPDTTPTLEFVPVEVEVNTSFWLAVPWSKTVALTPTPRVVAELLIWVAMFASDDSALARVRLWLQLRLH